MAPSAATKKKRLIFIGIGVTLMLVVIIVPISIELSQEKNQVPSTLDNRIECFPFKNMGSENCTKAGCLWETVSGQPSCFLPDSSVYGYEINSAQTNFPNNKGFSINLRRIRSADGTQSFSLYGNDIDEITFAVNYHSDNTLGIAFYPKGANPEQLRPPVAITFPNKEISDQRYEARLVNTGIGQPFNFQIIRRSSKVVIFDTSMGGLTVAKQFLMLSTKLPSEYLYGLGENTHDTFLHDMNYRMWPIFSRDISPIDEDVNLYGAHPFYMVCENDGSSHGVFFYNSHSIDVTTMPNPGLTFRTIGGMLEFFVFLGPEPESVVKQYSDVIGKTFMPPYFALGFQLSRWGYKNTSEIRQVIDRTRSVYIPHDIQYADIDYMDGRRDFTIDPDNFGDLPALVDEVKQDGLRFIIILDPAIANDYQTYDRGVALSVYAEWVNATIKPDDQPTDSNIIIGNVWPDNKTAFPDFFKKSTETWWTEEIRLFYQQLKFDALWIDMNEVSNFDTNLYSDKLQCPTNEWDDPPYETMAAHTGPTYRLSDKTICMVTKFGDVSQERLHYEVHNLYGYSQAIVTQRAVRQVLSGKRSMVLSRSTFAGSGQYTGHWLGDNFSTWKNMADSIIGMMEFNMFGMPYIGADICGFIFDTTEEMCERWMEIGAFYPFSRNHNNIDAIDQDPGIWPTTVAASGRKALNIRYRLLPYLYTLFYESHTTGSTVIRPLYHEFSQDRKARSIDKQFMWGPALLISPVLEEGKLSVDVYIPDDVWYDYYTGARVTVLGSTTLSAPRDHINLHLRGGYILPAQKPALNTMLSRQNNFELLVPLNDQNSASGKMFWDDGESANTIEDGLYQINTFELSNNLLTMKVEMVAESTWTGISQMLDTIEIMGWPNSPTKVSVKNSTDIWTLNADEYFYIVETKRLTISHEFDMNKDYTVQFE
ncbi:maltase-glucoamylase, intestinal-like [Daphnia pulicaria]|uniref:maltase-glucoamylase, intestinal-like n=1 Tax=Daphnia pulicaria TaxID=35523 RepID=UPI001EEA0768|nr:maltase-glucoamylase, intestinal-like [Daphnia pulicaria]